jgi:prepilin-type N-terminal cleavage/methylation domain-containing protein
MNSKWLKNKGFTLIEVMIALFILVMIGTTTSKAVIDAAKLKEVLKDETEFSSEFRTSTLFIERDLSQIFNPRWFLPPDLKPLDPYNPPPPPPPPAPGQRPPMPTLGVDEITRKTRGRAFQPTDFWGPILDPTGIRASRFKGKEAEISFVTASHVRIYQSKKESIYAKVRYELVKQEPNPNLNEEQNRKLAGLFSLVKVENTRAFELDEPKDAPYVNTYVILNNVKKLKFSYLKAGEKDSVREWDSESSDQNQKGKFPSSVEMEVTLVGPGDRILESKVLFNLETPNDVLPKTY